MENGKDLRLAVLIDADNIPYRLVSGILEEIAKYGVTYIQTYLCRLDKTSCIGMEGRFA